MVVFEETRPSGKLLVYDKQVAWKLGAFEATQSQSVEVPYETDEPLLIECQHFADCIRTRQQPRTPAEDGLKVLEVLQACKSLCN